MIDPARDIRRSANHEVFCLAGGMTATGPEGIGVGLCPVDAPLVSLGRRGLLRYSREFGTRKPIVFVNLYNNVWGTNFQQWIGGSWSARVRLWAVDGSEAQNDLVSRSRETRSRTKVAVFDGPAGALSPSQAGLELSRPGVLVTALGANPDGNGLVLRLWEQVGQSGTCRVRLPVGLLPAQARPCDLRGRARGKPIPVDDGWIEVSLTPFAPSSVLLQRRP
ncbi:MAG: glycosyl hydrolase-related protein [Pirellulaceae bacterium]